MTLPNEPINEKKHNAIQIRLHKGASVSIFKDQLKSEFGCRWHLLANGGRCWSCPIDVSDKINSFLDTYGIKADLKPHQDDYFAKPDNLQKVDRLFDRIDQLQKQHFDEDRNLIVEKDAFSKEILKRALDENSQDVQAKYKEYEVREEKQDDLKEEIEQLRNQAKLIEQKEKINNNKECNNEFCFLKLNSLISKPKKIRWIIKPYLDAESLCVLFGEPGSMKSFLAIDVGLCVAHGLAWHGSPVRESGSVFYIAGEGFHGLSRRLKAWTQDNNVNPDDIPFFVSNHSAQFLDLKSAAEVVTCINDLQKQHGTPALVIIDTLNRNFGNGDENTTEDMTAFVNNIDKYIRSRFGCAVLIVHHSPLNDSKRARGASALRAAADWEYCLSKVQGDTRKLTPTKVKDHEPPPDIFFEPVSVSLDGWIDEEDKTTMTSCVLKKINNKNNLIIKYEINNLTNSQKIALDCLINLIKEKNTDNGIHIDDWRTAAYEACISPADTKAAKKKAFQRAVEFLMEKGFVEGKTDYWKLKGDTGH